MQDLKPAASNIAGSKAAVTGSIWGHLSNHFPHDGVYSAATVPHRTLQKHKPQLTNIIWDVLAKAAGFVAVLSWLKCFALRTKSIKRRKHAREHESIYPINIRIPLAHEYATARGKIKYH